MSLKDRLPGLNRRQLLMGGAAAAGAVTVGGAWALYRTPGRLLEDVLSKALPGVSFEKDGMRLFKADFFSEYFVEAQAKLKLRATSSVSGITGLSLVESIGPVGSNLAEMERAAVSMMLNNSNVIYLQDPTAEPVIYWGSKDERACANPFARF